MYVSKIITKYTSHNNTFLNSTLHSYDFYLLKIQNLQAWGGLDHSKSSFIDYLDLVYGIKVTPKL
jgi:hypothetical protein